MPSRKTHTITTIALAVVSLILTSCTPYWNQITPTVPPETYISTSIPNKPIPKSIKNKSFTITYTVIGDVNIREYPEYTSKIVGYLFKGETVDAICHRDKWCKVDGGYMIAACLGGLEGICK